MRAYPRGLRGRVGDGTGRDGATAPWYVACRSLQVSEEIISGKLDDHFPLVRSQPIALPLTLMPRCACGFTRLAGTLASLPCAEF